MGRHFNVTPAGLRAAVELKPHPTHWRVTTASGATSGILVRGIAMKLRVAVFVVSCCRSLHAVLPRLRRHSHQLVSTQFNHYANHSSNSNNIGSQHRVLFTARVVAPCFGDLIESCNTPFTRSNRLDELARCLLYVCSMFTWSCKQGIRVLWLSPVRPFVRHTLSTLVSHKNDPNYDHRRWRSLMIGWDSSYSRTLRY